MYKAALSNEAKRGRNKFSGYKPKRKQINGRNKVKKKISLVLLTVLMICSCGKKQDLANSASPTKYVDSHDITNNNLNTNMLSLTEEQMYMILPYIKYGCYAIIAVGIAAVAYTTPIAYNYIFSPAGTLIMKGLSKIPKIGKIDFIIKQAAKPFLSQSSTRVEIAPNDPKNPIYTAPPPSSTEG